MDTYDVYIHICLYIYICSSYRRRASKCKPKNIYVLMYYNVVILSQTFFNKYAYVCNMHIASYITYTNIYYNDIYCLYIYICYIYVFTYKCMSLAYSEG